MNFNKYGRTAQLFDYQTMSYGLVGSILNSDGTITTNVASSSWTITKYIPVAGREFTLQRQASGVAPSICLYDSNQTYITGLAYNGNGTVTVSANTDVSYIRFTYYRTENTGNIMLNEGSTAKPFEPYSNTWHDIPHYIMGTSTDTITTLPAVLYPTGTTAAVGLKGNTTQTGTPTPDSPIMPNGTGERTENLLDKTGFTGVSATIEQIKDGIRIITPSGGFAAHIILDVLQNTNYTVSYIWKRISGNSTNTVRVFAGTDTSTEIAVFDYKTGGTFNTGNNTKINIWFYAYAVPGTTVTVEYTKIMLNTGSEALPYEPYGYKIPILSNSTTTPVYLGEVETTRKIKMLVLDGTEDWQIYGLVSNTYRLSISNTQSIGNPAICSHFVNSPISSITSGKFTVGSTWIYIRYADVADLADFKSYLQQQYAAGTPVTVWYVLATPTTGIVNEPLRKIGDYADTVSGITIPTITGADSFDVQTTLKPSEVTVNYKGWHPVADVHEYNSNYTIAAMQALTIAQLQTHTIGDLEGGE